MAFSRLSLLSKKKSLKLNFDNVKQFRQNRFDEGQQMTETIGVVKIHDNLYLGICAEEVRNKLTEHPPKKMFDRVACLSMLDQEYSRPPDSLDYHFVGEVPQQDLERNLPHITLDYNSEKLGDGEDSSKDFERQLPKLLDILDSYIVEGERVLVLINCFAGIIRACAMGMAFLMKNLNISADESLRKIRSVRSCVDPRQSFIDVLENYFTK